MHVLLQLADPGRKGRRNPCGNDKQDAEMPRKRATRHPRIIPTNQTFARR